MRQVEPFEVLAPPPHLTVPGNQGGASPVHPRSRGKHPEREGIVSDEDGTPPRGQGAVHLNLRQLEFAVKGLV
jgi:hypothetical protein